MAAFILGNLLTMAEITLLRAECKSAMRKLIADGVRVHSVLCDPPYGLDSITKRFGKNQAAAKTEGNDGSFSRLSKGFMGQVWDGSKIELDVEMWRLVFELLLPGGYLLAFSSPRTGHRMACAIEDAGFTMHPFIGWAYGSGLPKQKNADHFVAKEAPGQAKAWQGYAYGGQARKPALEPVYVAQRPFSERNGALNILKHGVGAVNIDGCRNERGNHPANLISDGSIANAEFFESYPFEDQKVFYAAKADKSDRAGSGHPSVKPIPLLRSLVRHITPPGGIVLDPFAGTGTTGAAAGLEGFNAILIEREITYANDIARRFDMETGGRQFLTAIGLGPDHTGK